MDQCILNYCKVNFNDDEVIEKYMELYNVVKYTMDEYKLNDNSQYSNLIILDIIHKYVNGKIGIYGCNYCEC